MYIYILVGHLSKAYKPPRKESMSPWSKILWNFFYKDTSLNQDTRFGSSYIEKCTDCPWNEDTLKNMHDPCYINNISLHNESLFFSNVSNWYLLFILLQFHPWFLANCEAASRSSSRSHCTPAERPKGEHAHKTHWDSKSMTTFWQGIALWLVIHVLDSILFQWNVFHHRCTCVPLLTSDFYRRPV